MDLDIPIQKVAFLGGFLPHRSSSSGFNTRLVQAFAAEYDGCECLGFAFSDKPRQYTYPKRVRFEITRGSFDSYRSAADFLKLQQVELVCLHHDPDLLEGQAGRYLLALVSSLQAPLVTCFPQVPEQPTIEEREAIKELAKRSARVMVPRPVQGEWLQALAGIPAEKVEISPILSIAGQAFPMEDDPAWRQAAGQYMSCFQSARQASIQRAVDSRLIPVTGQARVTDDIPVLKLDHFLRMSDQTGILKASVLGLPDYSQGYSTADNARALMFSLLLEQVGEGPFIPIEIQSSRQLAFLWNAFYPQRRRFRDALSYTRNWVDDEGSEDTHGLALWAVGMTLGRSNHPGMQGVARKLFEAALPAAQQLSSLRAWGFSLLGIDEYLRRYPGDREVVRRGRLLLDRLVHSFRKTAGPGWPWFEDALFANSASLPQALIASANWAGDLQVVEMGLRALDWLAEQQFSEEGIFTPFGSPNYCRRGAQPARFVQRPIDARSMISACLEAYRYSGHSRWLEHARGAFQWFLGRNVLGQPLYDEQTGGCCDGLLPGKADLNYSAESLLAFLTAQLEMRLFDQLYHRRMEASQRLPILQIGSSGASIQG